MKQKTADIFDKLILLAATVLLALQHASIPSAIFWQKQVPGHQYDELILIAVAGVFGALTPFETLSRRSRDRRAVTMRRIILSTFGQLLDIGRSIQPSLDVSDMGLHLWRKRRTLMHPLAGELVRASFYRLGSVPATRSFNAKRGVGVVGLCWKLNQEVSYDVAQLAAQLTDSQEFASYVAANGPDAVMGFTWAEFQQYSHRGAVFASPIRNGRSKFIGCISFDAQRGYTELNSNRLWHELNSLCVVLGEEGLESV